LLLVFRANLNSRHDSFTKKAPGTAIVGIITLAS